MARGWRPLGPLILLLGRLRPGRLRSELEAAVASRGARERARDSLRLTIARRSRAPPAESHISSAPAGVGAPPRAATWRAWGSKFFSPRSPLAATLGSAAGSRDACARPARDATSLRADRCRCRGPDVGIARCDVPERLASAGNDARHHGGDRWVDDGDRRERIYLWAAASADDAPAGVPGGRRRRVVFDGLAVRPGRPVGRPAARRIGRPSGRCGWL